MTTRQSVVSACVYANNGSLTFKIRHMSKTHSLFALILTFSFTSSLAQADSAYHAQLEANKQLALDFYNDLWNTNNTDKYELYMAETYVAHDIGDRKGITEPAIEQKNIADFFWANGDLKFTLDYQIAEGDLVATRWLWNYEPKTIFGKVLLGSTEIPIINVFRIVDGKIVELWNHRHDIDTSQTLRFTLQGLLIGLLIALIPTVIAIRLKRKLKRATTA